MIDCINLRIANPESDYVWASREFNFENVFNGMIFLFVMASLEAWPTLMIDLIDGPEFSHEIGP